MSANKLRWCAMASLSWAIRMKVASAVLAVGPDGAESSYHTDLTPTNYGQIALMFSESDFARIDGGDDQQRLSRELPDRILAAVNPLALGMLL